MAIRGKSKRIGRSKNGSTIAEFGPALSLLLITFSFPLINLMSLAVTAGSGFTLNHLQAQQAAYSKYSEAQAKVDAVKANWKQMGLGAFCNLASDPTTKVNIAAGQATPGQTDASNTQD